MIVLVYSKWKRTDEVLKRVKEKIPTIHDGHNSGHLRTNFIKDFDFKDFLAVPV